MGTSASFLGNNRRQSRIVAEVKEDNARLEARIQTLSEETSRLKAELREIAESCSKSGQAQALKPQIEASLSRCDRPNRCVIKVTERNREQKVRFGTVLPQCALANGATSAHSRQLKLERMLGGNHNYDSFLDISDYSDDTCVQHESNQNGHHQSTCHV